MTRYPKASFKCLQFEGEMMMVVNEVKQLLQGKANRKVTNSWFNGQIDG